MARGRGEGGGRQGKGEGLRLVRSPRHTAAGAATNISRYSRGIERASCCAFTAGSREICSFPLRQFDRSHRPDSIVGPERASARHSDGCETAGTKRRARRRRFTKRSSFLPSGSLSLQPPSSGFLSPLARRRRIYVPRPRLADSFVLFGVRT